MKQLFGFTGNGYYAFLPSCRNGNAYNLDTIEKNQGVVMTYYASERKSCADILLSEKIFESDFNEDRVSDMKEYLIDRKITGLETINPDWEICVDYTIYDNTGRIVNSGISRVDAQTTDIQLARSVVGADNELVYTYGKKADGTVCINVGHQASYGLKRVNSIYPLQLVINRIYIQGNTYADELMSKLNKMRAARCEPSPHRRHSDLLTDPRYFYDRYPHQCQPIDILPPSSPSFPGMEGGTSYDSRYPMDEYGRPTYYPILGMNDKPIPPDYVPGPIPYIDHYCPVPNPKHPCHPMHHPLPKYYNGVDHAPAFRYMSCAAKKAMEEKYRRVPHYQAPRITIYEIDGRNLRYNGVFRQEVHSICMNISIVLDNFVLVKDDSEIIKILEGNSPLTSTGEDCFCDCNPLHHHRPFNKPINHECQCQCCKKENEDNNEEEPIINWSYYSGLVWDDKSNPTEWEDNDAVVRSRVLEWFNSTNSDKIAPVCKFTNKNGECSISGNYGYPIFMWESSQGDIKDILDNSGSSVLANFKKYTISTPSSEYFVYIMTNNAVDASENPIYYTLSW